MTPGKLFHNRGAQTENAQSAVECCALELVAGTASLLTSEADLRPGLVRKCFFSKSVM